MRIQSFLFLRDSTWPPIVEGLLPDRFCTVVSLTSFQQNDVIQFSVMLVNPCFVMFFFFFFSETVTLLFEVTELSHVSPALVTRCGLIHCPETTVGWKSIFRSWMKGAHARWDITNRG